MRIRPIVYVFLVAMLLAIGMGGCGKPAKPKSTNGSESTSSLAPVSPRIDLDRTGWPLIVAYGDSLTFGQGVSATSNYPSQLQAELDRKGYKYRVVNAGISGDTTQGGLNRVDLVVRQNPAIVILELGANDGLQGKSVPQMRVNLATVIERLQQEKIPVVLAGMEIPPNYGPEYTESFRQTFPDLAKRYHLPLIPFFLDGVGGKPELNLPDGIHPTAKGYVYVVQNVMKVLEPMLTK